MYILYFTVQVCQIFTTIAGKVTDSILESSGARFYFMIYCLISFDYEAAFEHEMRFRINYSHVSSE